MREVTIHKPAACGWSVSGHLEATFTSSQLRAQFVRGRQMGKRRVQRAWLQYLLTAPPDTPRPPLMARAVRFALEHWHA